MACVYADLPNHSEDLLEVWYGRPEPVLICGYHEMRFGIPPAPPVPETAR